MDPRPPGQGGGLSDQFRRMNVNAQSFVPNVQAPSFVPYGPYGGYPPMHGEMRGRGGEGEGGRGEAKWEGGIKRKREEMWVEEGQRGNMSHVIVITYTCTVHVNSCTIKFCVMIRVFT